MSLSEALLGLVVIIISAAIFSLLRNFYLEKLQAKYGISAEDYEKYFKPLEKEQMFLYLVLALGGLCAFACVKEHALKMVGLAVASMTLMLFFSSLMRCASQNKKGS